MNPILPSNYDGILNFVETIWNVAPLSTIQVAQANSSRIYIAFMAGTNTVAIFPKTNPVGVHGFLLPSPGLIKFTWEKDGILPTLDWYIAEYAGGANAGTMWEQFYTP